MSPTVEVTVSVRALSLGTAEAKAAGWALTFGQLSVQREMLRVFSRQGCSRRFVQWVGLEQLWGRSLFRDWAGVWMG